MYALAGLQTYINEKIAELRAVTNMQINTNITGNNQIAAIVYLATETICIVYLVRNVTYN